MAEILVCCKGNTAHDTITASLVNIAVRNSHPFKFQNKFTKHSNPICEISHSPSNLSWWWWYSQSRTYARQHASDATNQKKNSAHDLCECKNPIWSWCRPGPSVKWYFDAESELHNGVRKWERTTILAHVLICVNIQSLLPDDARWPVASHSIFFGCVLCVSVCLCVDDSTTKYNNEIDRHRK